MNGWKRILPYLAAGGLTGRRLPIGRVMTALNHRWPRFTLRTLFVAVTLAASFLGWVASEIVRKNHRVMVRLEIERVGGAWNSPFMGEPRHYSRWALTSWL